MKKIDAHAHIGSFGGWAAVANTTETLLADMDQYEIEKTIVCTGDNITAKQARDRFPDRFLPLYYANPHQGRQMVEELYHYVLEEQFVGIKLNPLRHAYVADDAMLDPLMAAAKELELPVFIHCGHPPYSLPWSIALLAERFPQVPVVMIHMGHGHGVYIDASLKMARRYDNLYLEMSGMPMQSKIKEAYETVGSSRIMFGTDAPFHHPSIELQKVLVSGLDEIAQQAVFYNNAARLIGGREAAVCHAETGADAL